MYFLKQTCRCHCYIWYVTLLQLLLELFKNVKGVKTQHFDKGTMCISVVIRYEVIYEVYEDKNGPARLLMRSAVRNRGSEK